MPIQLPRLLSSLDDSREQSSSAPPRRYGEEDPRTARRRAQAEGLRLTQRQRRWGALLLSSRELSRLAFVTLLLSASAHAGDILVTARGVVTDVSGGTPAAPFAGVAVGDPVEFYVEVIDAPFVNSPTFWEYETDPWHGGLRIGSAFLPTSSGGPGEVNLQNETIDAVTIGAPLAFPFVTGVTAGLLDFSGQFLQSPDISQVVGQTMTSSFPGAAILASSVNATIVRMEITTITFGVAACPLIGSNSCSTESNSTGFDAITYACGSAVASQNDVTLAAGALPSNAFGFFLCSQTAGFSSQPGGSSGNLCLAGAIGRFVGPGQIRNSGAYGLFELPIDLTRLPSPNGLVAGTAGQTWHFTAWYRDVSSTGAPTSNFSDRLSLSLE
ncbi:hypothetical protein Poly30_14160 [Planctomycetes bacterium Poly30]|uniref:Uncharacterized protein n=1 Tax=Saltatorellus ferox TaxID=2528018 RepID=A0A518EPA1_9BACT|nr:hypothetical protein Poly30_14160 [Planctomycetes bacterium Poly30]